MNKERHLTIIENRKQEIEMIESLIRKEASHNEPIRILEAGCGRQWPFKLEGIQHILTGVDMDKSALEIRKNTLGDLHEAVEGDLRSVILCEASYDVIYCFFVLEHVKQADVVMKNFIKWLKPNGLIIIKIPDPYSVHGYITRNTAFWFHVFYYRFILGYKNSGKPGFAPYPTYYHSILSRRGMRNFCEDITNSVVLAAEYGDGYIKPGRGSIKTLLHLFKRIINIISIGALSDKHTNLLYIIRKQNA